MAETKVIMPQMGESIFEGTITKWLKKTGDHVERDEPLFEISTDKVDTEIPAPAAGTLQEILVKEGQTVQINTVVAVISDGAGAASASAPQQETKAPAEQAQKPSTEAKPKSEGPKPEGPKPGVPPGPAPVAGPVATAREEVKERAAGAETIEGELRSSPLVRRIAKDHGINLTTLAGRGTGINGRITKRDILSHIEQGGPSRPAAPGAPIVLPAAPPKAPPAPPSAPPRPSAQPSVPKAPAAPPAPSLPQGPPVQPVKFSGEVERVPMTNMRKSIAEHMVMSRRTSAHVTTIFEVDCTRIQQAREKLKAEFERSGVRLTVTPFFIQAAINALKKYPIVNASVEGDTIVYKRAINIGIAVSLDWGLIVPVIKNADEKNLLGLARALNDLGERARNKKLGPDDVQGGTFTITNPGPYGAVIGTPIISQPQVAIMGMGGIKKRPVVIDDAIGIRPIIMLSLSFDHRIIDGAVADQFMAEVQRQLEGWTV